MRDTILSCLVWALVLLNRVVPTNDLVLFFLVLIDELENLRFFLLLTANGEGY